MTFINLPSNIFQKIEEVVPRSLPCGCSANCHVTSQMSRAVYGCGFPSPYPPLIGQPSLPIHLYSLSHRAC
ncbi:hypothetical protein HOLleu_06977 [Holothuria leucospilota]|uniref:Uncharacterized protein n=1 Tax=Holothuria leucospilota TaxID=206669 RepID=A0A9Q1CN93_HOLLE|nr:hypothetical protein HOLleu_06977 [Holothuria leucospilota]